MRIRHYAQFHSTVRELDWDELRNNASEPGFHVPCDRESYMERVEACAPVRLASAIASFMHEHEIESVFSIGTGIGALEYQLKGSVDRVIVTDITESIDRLGSFELFDDAFRFDILRDPFPESNMDMVLLPRIDTEFTDHQFRAVFTRLRNHEVEYICLVPTSFLDLRMILLEGRVWLRGLASAKRPVFCGYLRDFRGLEQGWKGPYRVLPCDASLPVVFLEAS